MAAQGASRNQGRRGAAEEEGVSEGVGRALRRFTALCRRELCAAGGAAMHAPLPPAAGTWRAVAGSAWRAGLSCTPPYRSHPAPQF